MGVLVQMHDLRRLGIIRRFCVLVTEGVKGWAKQLLHERGAEVIVVERIPFKFIGAPSYAVRKWTEAVVKLRIFQQFQFSRIVYLDVDVLVRKNIDNLFDLPLDDSRVQLYGMSDMHDCGVRRDKLNSGVLVFSPSPEKWKKIMSNYDKAASMPRWEGDQDLIEYTFSGKTVILPESTAAMLKQFQCGRDLSESSLVHGGGWLPMEMMSLYGMQLKSHRNEGFLSACGVIYEAWFESCEKECKQIELFFPASFAKMNEAKLCKLQPFQGSVHAEQIKNEWNN